ncbi:FecR family protein [Sphaerotilus sp.]|uniref:FecR family protein n=1 Tax=Sphaerotilus sp. TaxID=2093942 RepID=UPI002ACE8E79|nr:FecR family protein [Sphaerotilus sp.]
MRQRAAEWLVELQADTADDATQVRLREWRAAHPDHERAWQHVEAFGLRLQAMPADLARAALAASGETHPPRRRQAIKTLALMLFAGGSAWALREATPWPEWVADERTGPGERRSLALADGTRVDLNAGTALDVRYGAHERLLRLVQGEILVTTAHEPGPLATVGRVARPFVVETANGRIQALGTRFAVRRLAGGGDPDASLVSVYEGAVSILPRSPSGANGLAPEAGHLLRAGESARFRIDSVLGAGQADPAATAWTQGMIVAQDMPLADFAAEVNRQAEPGGAGRWVCEPAVAALRVTGTYPLADRDKLLNMLQTALPIRAQVQRRWWGGAVVVLVRRSS